MKNYIIVLCYGIFLSLSILSTAQTINGSSNVSINDVVSYSLSSPITGRYNWKITGGTLLSHSNTSCSVKWDGQIPGGKVEFQIHQYSDLLGAFGMVTQVSLNVNVNIPPPAPPNPSNPVEASYSNPCGPKHITTTGTPPSGVSWYWRRELLVPVSEMIMYPANVDFQVNSSGTYYLFARNNSSGAWSNGYGFVDITIPDPVSPGSISGSKTICYDGDAGTLSGTSASGGVGAYTYQWQKKVGNNSWQDIPSTNSLSHSPGSLTTTTNFRREVTNQCATKYSNQVTITVRTQLSGGAISGSKSICENTNAGLLSSTSVATGGAGNITYQWQEKNDGGNWININGATGSSYNANEDLSVKTYYRRRSTDSSCGVSYSNTVTIDIDLPSQGGVASENTTDFGISSGRLVLANHRGNVVRWEKVVNGNTTPITSANSYYDYSNVMETTDFRAVVKNGVCAEVNSSSATITILAIPSITIHGDAFIAPGGQVDISTDDGFYSYTWRKDGAILTESGHRLKVNKPGNYDVTTQAVANGSSYQTGIVQIKPAIESQNKNYVKTTVFTKSGISSATNVYDLAMEDYSVSTEYFDGLGKRKETVLLGQSPDGKDILTVLEYDDFGRVKRTFLPYTNGKRTGRYDKNALLNTVVFYENSQGDAYPFSEVIYESSPLNRIVEQGAAGAAWQPGSASIKYAYELNSESDDILQLKVGANDLLESSINYYGEGDLLRNVTIDEEGHKVLSFVNGLNQTILKRVQANESETLWADTYYAYDYKGNLRLVLPPEASITIDEYFNAVSDNERLNFLANWAFQYKYDHRNRMVEKKVPGADWVYMVYDDRDRLVLTQDGNQRLDSKWTFTKYDVLNRPIMTGEKVIATPEATLRDLLDGSDWLQNYAAYETLGGDKFGYTSNSFPKNITTEEIHTVTYYDAYNFPHAPSYSFVSELGHDAPFDRVKGQVTGTKIKTLDGTNTWLEGVTYYDDRYRMIQSQTETLVGIDRVTNQYDFTGNVVQTKTTHATVNANAETVNWSGLVNMTDNSGVLTKDAAGYSWNAGASSIQTMPINTDGFITFSSVAVHTKRMIGLSTTDADANWNTIGFAFYLLQDGTYEIRENGSINKLMTSMPYAVGDNFKIERVGSEIKYYHNTALVRTATAPNTALLVDVSVHTPGYTLETINIASEATSTTEENTTTRRFDYDHARRLIDIWHQIDDGEDVLLAHNEYNELGELIDKKLFSDDGGTNFEQSVDYRYNIRGWLTQINDPILSDGEDDYFGMNLGYNEDIGLNIPASDLQYNGNISAVKWSDGFTNTSTSVGYSYQYDPMNRITKAQSATTTPNAFNLDAIDYDLNGNIESLTRMNANGTAMDVLAYDYGSASSRSNQLLGVTDNAGATFKDEGFKDGNVGNDYLYDANGNMTQDLNKNIESISYNHLNLPDRVIKTDGQYIQYTYDASGIKLAQEVYNAGNMLQKRTDYVGEFIYETNEEGIRSLALIQHEEGRIVPDEIEGDYDYEYFLKDHLGNTRVVFTTDPKTHEFALNYESNTADPDDEAFFDNLQSVIAADVHDRVDAANESFNHDKVQLLNGATNGVVGSVLTIPVGQGDKISAEVYAKYLAPTGTNNPTAAIGSLLTAALTGGTSLTGYESSINSSFGTTGNITGLVNSNASSTEPMAFINLMFLPENVGSSVADSHFAFKQITSASSNNHAILALDEPYEAPESGYVVVYLSNESAQLTEVYFDDLKITVNEHPVIETNSYYPFGMQHSGGFNRVTAKENRFKYNGFEYQEDLGINLYDYLARQYDPAIGRFTSVDPAADLMRRHSPYNYAFDNPIRFIDPDGMMAEDVVEGQEEKKKKQQQENKDQKANEEKSTKKSFGGELWEGTKWYFKFWGDMLTPDEPIELGREEDTEKSKSDGPISRESPDANSDSHAPESEDGNYKIIEEPSTISTSPTDNTIFSKYFKASKPNETDGDSAVTYTPSDEYPTLRAKYASGGYSTKGRQLKTKSDSSKTKYKWKLGKREWKGYQK